MNITGFIVPKKLLLLVVIILLLVVFFWAIKKSDAKPQPSSCTEAKSEGLFNIPRSSPYYRPSLDRNSNGLACEL